MKYSVLSVVWLFFALTLSAQNPTCYRIYLSDKANSPYSIDNPSAYLSQRAIDKRARFNIPITEQDLPVNPQYKQLPIIHHSDRGSQYCSLDYVKLMKRNGMEISMTESGDPRDNPIAERVNGTIKNEYLYPLQVSMTGLRMRVQKAIHMYNAERPHLSLGMNTPEQVYRTGCETHRLWKNYYPYYDDVNKL